MDIPNKTIAIKPDLQKVPGCDIVASYRRSVAQNALRLARHGFKECPKRVHDLCLITAAVAYADRAVQRRRHIWQRHLTLIVPVYEPEFWEQPAVNSSLCSLLSLLTGDRWYFRFEGRLDRPETVVQQSLSLPRGELHILPYSHGLDSFALWRLQLAEAVNSGIILLTCGNAPIGFADFKQRPFGRNRIEHLTLPLYTRLDPEISRETSYRSRPFIFGIAASIAAYFADSECVLVPEAGQGTFGPWLDPVGHEIPDVRTHPIFTRALADFAALVLGHPLRFEHPHLWTTKGEVLRRLVAIRVHDGWETTISCANRRKLTVLEGRRVNCGACAACLLRRASLHTAGLSHVVETYLWADLTAADLRSSASPGARSPTEDDHRQFAAGIAAMERFARRSEQDLTIAKPVQIFQLAQSLACSTDAVANQLQAVIKSHRYEWDAFCETLGPRSFVNEFRSRLPVRHP